MQMAENLLTFVRLLSKQHKLEKGSRNHLQISCQIIEASYLGGEGTEEAEDHSVSFLEADSNTEWLLSVLNVDNAETAGGSSGLWITDFVFSE